MNGLRDRIIDRIPLPEAGVETEVVDGEVLLYHPLHTRAVYLNPIAAVIWCLCDGKRSVRTIIDLVSGGYPDADASLPEGIVATLDELEESGVLVVG